MAVLVRIAAPGMDQEAYDETSSALQELVKKQPGFIIHVAYPTPGGFAVGEVWESEAQPEAWFNEHVAPALPAEAVEAMSTEVIQLHSVVRP
jgi:heme-degrading monooxygenase HmoA